MFSTKQKVSETPFSGLALLAWSRLIHVAQKVGRTGSEQLAQHGLTPAQFDLLRRVRTGRDLTQQVLVDQLGVTRGNVSQLLGKLEAEGLVLRSPQGSAKVLRLTESGEALVAELLPEHDRFIAECFSALSEAEQQQLVTLLSKLEDSLG